MSRSRMGRARAGARRPAGSASACATRVERIANLIMDSFDAVQFLAWRAWTSCLIAASWFRSRLRGLLTLGVSAMLGTLLLVACGDPPRPAQAAAEQTPTVRQTGLRPRALATVATTVEAIAPTATTDSLQKVAAIASDAGFIQVAAGDNHACALRGDGRVECWGANDQGQLDVPRNARFQQITSGWRFTCGIQTDDTLSCWGRNNHQQADPPGGAFQAVDAGWDHACALSGTTAVCWGRNANERATPLGDAEFTAIGAGAEHSCGLTVDGDLVCWGKNDNGRATSRTGRFRALAVGIAHTCVLREDGTALCQGENIDGQSSPPATVFTGISAGSDYTCGRLATGHLECWGANPDGSANVAYAPPGRFTSVSLGWASGCGINPAGHVTCWTSAHAARPVHPFDRRLINVAVPGSVIENPTEVLPWPGGGLAAAEKSGSIVVVNPSFDAKQLLDLASAVDSNGGEKGFLSVAVDPQFEDYKFIYVYYTLNVGDDPTSAFARLSRFSVVNGTIARDSELVILDVHRNTEADIHWGGAIRFGPDGMLYLGIGDSTCWVCAQDLGSLHGKIIRIDVREASTDQPYRIPVDNPFADDPEARPEVWALGMRNPWRMAFDSQDGSLWVGDVGDRFEEEVTVVTRGANLGWPILEGSLCTNIDDFIKLNEYGLEEYTVYGYHSCTNIKHFSLPTISYTTRRTGNCAIIGGLVYRGQAIPWLKGTYVWGDFCSGRVWALGGDADGGRQMVQIVDLDELITTFGIDEDGELLIATFGGSIFRLLEADAGFAPSVTHVPLVTTLTTPSDTGVAKGP